MKNAHRLKALTFFTKNICICIPLSNKSCFASNSRETQKLRNNSSSTNLNQRLRIIFSQVCRQENFHFINPGASEIKSLQNSGQNMYSKTVVSVEKKCSFRRDSIFTAGQQMTSFSQDRNLWKRVSLIVLLFVEA